MEDAVADSKPESALSPIPDEFIEEIDNTLDRDAYHAGSQELWVPVDMNECDPKSSFNVDSSARGFNSNRIAIMFWKQHFRGDGLFGGNSLGKCSKYAEDAQYALSRSHVKHLIEPLEKAGYVVDVLLDEMASCNNVNTEAQLVQRTKKIHGIYGDRVVKKRSHNLTANQFETVTLGAQFALEFLRESKVAYRSLLMWRFDVLSVSPLKATVYNEGMESEPLIRDLPSKNYDSSDFADWSRQGLGIFIEDNILSMGGWVAPCVLYGLSQGKRTSDVAIHGGEWRNTVWSNNPGGQSGGVHGHDFVESSAAVYRGPFVHSFYSNGAMKSCKMLNSLFEGPTCNLNGMALLVCESECNRQVGSAGKAPTCFENFWQRLDDRRKGELKGIEPMPDRQGNTTSGRSFDPRMDELADDATAPHREDC